MDNELDNLLGLSASEIERIENFNDLFEEEAVNEPTLTARQIPDDAVNEPTLTAQQVPDDAVNEILGTPGNDPNLNGTDFNDRIFAFEGDDIVTGGAGEDTIDGGSGDDNLAGQDGDDSIIGGSGIDLIFGDGGLSDNPLELFNGSDIIYGGEDRDIIVGGFENDSLYGEEGNDNLSGQNGNDSLDGGSGPDNIQGGEDNDTLAGGNGNDSLFGEDVNDLLMGGDGDDFLHGDRSDLPINAIGQDTLEGNNGNDKLIGGAESDSLNGGAGSDTLIGVENSQIEFDFGADTIDTLTGGLGRDTFVLGGPNENGEEVVYYDDGNPEAQGTDDYALITDFAFGDTFDYVGSFSDYRLDASPAGEPSGVGIYLEQGETDELIAIVQFSLFGSASSRTVNSRGLSSEATLDLSGNSADLSTTDFDSATNIDLVAEGF